MTKPLDGYRVIDLSEGPAAGLATMILADFGAEVIKVEQPPGDPFRAHPASRVWLRGKKSVVWDPRDGDSGARVRELVLDTAEAVVTTLADELGRPHGLDGAALCAARPDLVLADVSALGGCAPFDGLPLHEGLAAAKGGRMMSFRGLLPREGPVFSALEVATHAVSQAVATGVAAGLLWREQSGLGTRFSTSLLRGLLPYEMGGLIAAQLDAAEGERPVGRAESGRGSPAVPPDPFTAMPTINYHPVQCRDGRWLQLGNLLPHLLRRFLAVAGLDDLLEEPELQQPPAMWPRERLEAFRDRLLRHMQTRTSDEWMRLFVADGGIVAHPYQTTQQALEDPDIVANGHVVVRDRERQLGLVARLSVTPGEPGSPPQAVGTTRLAELGLKRAVSMRPDATRPTARGPLDGTTVVELATIIAAPLGACMLADLGARVIKVEPLDGDPFRSMGGGVGAARVNAGKESILIDLKREAGQHVAGELIGRADLLIHNYRPGVPDKLGIGYEQACELNPGLVYVNVNGYGPLGPGAHRPSTHPIPGAALGGVLWQIGGEPPRALGPLPELREMARRLFRANEVNPDPNTSMVVATAAVLGLLAKNRHGAGQQIHVDMFGANAYANFDDFFDHPGKPPRRLPDEDLFGLSPFYRLYSCRSGWIFLAAEQPGEQALLRAALAELGSPMRVVEDLASTFAKEDADWWERELAARRVGCVRADGPAPARFLLGEHARQERLVVEARHRDWGTYLRHGAVLEIESAPSLRGACAAGEHTESILAELGYDANAIATLLAQKVVGNRTER